MLAVTRPAGSRRAGILAHLAEHPDLTGYELARALGTRSPLLDVLQDMQRKGQVTARSEWRHQVGRHVSVWRVAPPGEAVMPSGGGTPAAPARLAVLPLLSGPACQDVNPDLFFPEPGEPDGRARAVCLPCPVRRECYELARARGEEHGIWGGINFETTTHAKGHKAS